MWAARQPERLLNYTTIIIPETYRANRILFFVENNNWNCYQYLPKKNDFVDGDLVMGISSIQSNIPKDLACVSN